MGEQVVFLKGKKVILRPMEKGDLERCRRWMNDPEVRCFLKSNFPYTMEDEEEWFERARKDQNSRHFAIVAVDGETPVLIGNIGLAGINWKNGTATTGTVIGEKEYWSKGYGTEAKMLLLYHAFYELGLRKINSSVWEFNSRSLKYSDNCGYKEEGRKRKQLYRGGQYWDEVLLAVFREEWVEIWERFKREKLS